MVQQTHRKGARLALVPRPGRKFHTRGRAGGFPQLVRERRFQPRELWPRGSSADEGLRTFFRPQDISDRRVPCPRSSSGSSCDFWAQRPTWEYRNGSFFSARHISPTFWVTEISLAKFPEIVSVTYIWKRIIFWAILWMQTGAGSLPKHWVFFKILEFFGICLSFLGYAWVYLENPWVFLPLH